MLIRIKDVVRLTGLSRSTIYRLAAERQFPQPVKLGPRASAWRLAEIESWAKSLPVSNLKKGA